jgi:hypothetical protein
MTDNSGRVGVAETGSHPAGQANLRCPDASRFDPARVAALVDRVKNARMVEDHPAMAEFWDDILEAFDALTTEMARRDENERRNCLNWGPCSRMSEEQST